MEYGKIEYQDKLQFTSLKGLGDERRIYDEKTNFSHIDYAFAVPYASAVKHVCGGRRRMFAPMV